MILKPGARFWEYEVVRLIGEGGMSRVWLVRDSLNNYYAAKEPRPGGHIAVNISKIRFEALILQRVRHPNVVNLIRAFEVVSASVSPKPVILVLELAGDGTLERLAPLEERAAVELFRQAAYAVQYMHQVGVVHRDIKPSNVLLSGGVPKLSDFGTAKFLREQFKETVYSPGGYTAPEQFRGEAFPQSDVWSLGALLFFLVTGRAPADYMPGYPHHAAPPDPRWANPYVSDRVANVILRAMQPSPAWRYPTVSDMLNELLGYSPAARPGLTLVVYGVSAYIPEAEVVVGRNLRGDFVELVREGRDLVLAVPDPQKHLEKRHCRIFEHGGRWYVQDLGSLNRTAVYRGGVWYVVHKRRGQPSEPFELQNGNYISLAYDRSKGPYLLLQVILR